VERRRRGAGGTFASVSGAWRHQPTNRQSAIAIGHQKKRTVYFLLSFSKFWHCLITNYSIRDVGSAGVFVVV
jgi:hypothetical protein